MEIKINGCGEYLYPRVRKQQETRENSRMKVFVISTLYEILG
jgi:hypothetical protein